MTTVPALASDLRPRVLCVDDEPVVLEAITRNLARDCLVVTATSGAEGLALLERDPAISVVITDMRMPVMNGADFLARARVLAPDAVRLLLTGQADLDSAIAAVNEGAVFRFLTKPCPLPRLRDTVASAVAQHHLVTSERVLLEQTLRGSIKALVDVLALVSPATFGRVNRLKTRALAIATELGISELWQIEVAALLSQLGLVGLPEDLCQRIQRGASLNAEEQRLAARVPATTESLLANIPRIDAVREMIALHLQPPRIGPARKLGEVGAHVLRVALDADTLEPQLGAAARVALFQTRGYDRAVIEALERCGSRIAAVPSAREVALAALRVGMVFAEDVLMSSGALLVARGYEITPGFIERVRNFPPGTVRSPLSIATP